MDNFSTTTAGSFRKTLSLMFTVYDYMFCGTSNSNMVKLNSKWRTCFSFKVLLSSAIIVSAWKSLLFMLSVIVCLLEESERCLPVVMIFLQQRKDLLDHHPNENSQQKAAAWSLHVVALKSNLHFSAIQSPSVSVWIPFSSTVFF